VGGNGGGRKREENLFIIYPYLIRVVKGIFEAISRRRFLERQAPENKPSPKLDDSALTREIMRLFKQDLSGEQIAGRLEVLYPGQEGKQASTSTIYTYL
jgi:IS30 family transposase